MATQTTYYEFNKPSGTDLVNPLVDTNPNWDIADAALHELNERSVANCTEVVSLGVHALSTLNTDTKFLKWIATANYTAGETFTLNGVAVAAATPSGASLATNAYVTGAVVMACLNADNSAMTVFLSGTNVAYDSERLGGELPSYYATDSDMGNAQTDITNIQNTLGNTSIVGIGDGTVTGAIDSINSALNKGSVYVTADGVKTTQALLAELFALVDMNKVNNRSVLSMGTYVAPIVRKQPNQLWFTSAMVIDAFSISSFILASTSHYYACTGSSPVFNNNDAYVWPSGEKFELFY